MVLLNKRDNAANLLEYLFFKRKLYIKKMEK